MAKHTGHRPKRRDAKPGIPCGLSIDTHGHTTCKSAVTQIGGVWLCPRHAELIAVILAAAGVTP